LREQALACARPLDRQVEPNFRPARPGPAPSTSSVEPGRRAPRRGTDRRLSFESASGSPSLPPWHDELPGAVTQHAAADLARTSWPRESAASIDIFEDIVSHLC
jgi:hypothetical protein